MFKKIILKKEINLDNIILEKNDVIYIKEKILSNFNYDFNIVFTRYGGKGVAGNFGNENPSAYKHMVKTRTKNEFKFDEKDKLFFVDARGFEGGEALFCLVADKEDWDLINYVHSSTIGMGLLFMDIMGVIKVKEKRYVGVILFYGSNNPLEAIDLRQHSLNELKSNLQKEIQALEN